MAAEVIAIIPARGGSTRIPGKNIKEFNGRPILEWPILACSELPGISQIVISTDDPQIAEIALSAGASHRVERPAELASDTAGTAPVIRHALADLAVDDETLVLCIYATATVTPAVVSEAIELSRRNPDEFVVTVGRHRSPSERALVARDDLMALASMEHLYTRTQDLPHRYFDAGKLYLARAALWRARDTMMEVPFVPLHLPEWATVDIDEPEDWPIAEALHRVFVLEAL